MDLSTDGMGLPLLVAAGLAVLQYLMGGKAPAAPGVPSAPSPGPFDVLKALLGKKAAGDKVTVSVTTDRPEVVEAILKAEPKG